MHRNEACTLQSVMRLQLRAHARSFVCVRVNWQSKSLRGNVLRAQQTLTQTQGNTNYSRLPAKFTILQLHKAILVHVHALCFTVWQRFCFVDALSRRQSTQATRYTNRDVLTHTSSCRWSDLSKVLGIADFVHLSLIQPLAIHHNG